MKYLILMLFAVTYCLSSTQAYFFWLKSADNTITNIQQIEKKYNIHLPLIGFIFDPRGPDAIKTINNLTTEFGPDRIYHITISPDKFSAKQVAEGKFDDQYKIFFKLIKDNNLRVVFRTMHEMNGGRYPRSSDPKNFKKARIHIRNLSREEWLQSENILFDMSVNHRDMPTKDPHPSQTSRLIQCSPRDKEKKQCPTFEDYYPGDKYVDIMGFTFYNRGKASYDRARISPEKIVNQPGRNTLSRLKSFNKPIFIDEVATTAVRYDWKYTQKQSIQSYKNDTEGKNKRLTQLKDLMLKEPRIAWLVYFNVDYTNGLTEKLIGEADRSAINLDLDKTYKNIFQLYKKTDKANYSTLLTSIFNIQLFTYTSPDFSGGGTTLFIKTAYIQPIKKLLEMTKNVTGSDDKNMFLNNMIQKGLLKNIYKRFDEQELQEIINHTKKFLLE